MAAVQASMGHLPPPPEVLHTAVALAQWGCWDFLSCWEMPGKWGETRSINPILAQRFLNWPQLWNWYFDGKGREGKVTMVLSRHDLNVDSCDGCDCASTVASHQHMKVYTDMHGWFFACLSLVRLPSNARKWIHARRVCDTVSHSSAQPR